MPHTYRTLHARSGLYYPTRRERIDLIVIHCGEGDRSRVGDESYQPSAAGYARYFTSPNARGSAHLSVDDHEVWRSVHDHETAFGAKGHNANGLHIELGGFAAWTAARWLAHEPTLREGARIVAGWMSRYAIPLRQAPRAADGRMRWGWHSHRGLPGNDHTDPGQGFPWPHFLDLVGQHLEDRPERADSLQLVITPPGGTRRVWVGWDEAFPAVKWVAKNGLRPGARAAIAWKGAVWRDPKDVVNVASSLARRFG